LTKTALYASIVISYLVEKEVDHMGARVEIKYCTE